MVKEGFDAERDGIMRMENVKDLNGFWEYKFASLVLLVFDR